MSPQRSDFRHVHPIRVRWSEVDPQSIVFNGHYLTYADVTITEYFRAIELSFPGDLAREGGDFFAVKTLLEYQAPARFDDELQVAIRVSRLGRSSITFALAIWREERLLTTGEIVYVHADTSNRRSKPLPQWLCTKVRDFEHCAPHEQSSPSLTDD